ncbi:putative lipid II flippase FtsW [Anaerovorax sp. IOR16]|uniref:putative lipid II flippase FtsW n=1 Tax=Anaerovorax sp. IOR16 TaxID=2773458 RepID=UPI0019D129DA|nr:putative lipid II flippase FtsW [Anaerovorax sp. IOR16]
MAKKQRENEKIKMKTGDFVLTILMMGLVLFGIIMVFSASYYVAISDYGNPYYYLIRDAIWAFLGTILFVFCRLFPYKYYKKMAFPLMIISFVLLLLLFTPLGKDVNGATRWIRLGSDSLTIMPGEIAKICAILFVAKYLSDKPKRILSFTEGILPLVILCGAYFGLIMKQPNMSTAITVVAIIVGMMFVAGLNLKYLFAIGIAGCAGIVALILAEPYRMKRMFSFIDPFQDPLGTGWQVTQSLLALGSGGLFGVGLGKSIQKTLYLPEPQNDFIFAIIGEELGYIGCLILIAVYIVLIWRCAHISLNAPDLFGMLIASGITIMLAVQVILNIAVVTSSMPPTGIILPFVSFGGNALLLFMGSMGIMLNISKHSAK